MHSDVATTYKQVCKQNEIPSIRLRRLNTQSFARRMLNMEAVKETTCAIRNAGVIAAGVAVDNIVEERLHTVARRGRVRSEPTILIVVRPEMLVPTVVRSALLLAY